MGLLRAGDCRNTDGDLTCCDFCGVEGVELSGFTFGEGTYISRSKTINICGVCRAIVNESVLCNSHLDSGMSALVVRGVYALKILLTEAPQIKNVAPPPPPLVKGAKVIPPPPPPPKKPKALKGRVVDEGIGIVFRKRKKENEL